MPITIIAHNIRSAHNVGAIFRTCEGFGVEKLIFSGYTPYPELTDDVRLPHIRRKITRDIHKTALGAERIVPFEQHEDVNVVLSTLHTHGYHLAGLEQDETSISLPDFTPPQHLALLLGEEVGGIAPELRSQCDTLLEIPMYGQKESFNVSVAAGIALYALTSHF